MIWLERKEIMLNIGDKESIYLFNTKFKSKHCLKISSICLINEVLKIKIKQKLSLFIAAILATSAIFAIIPTGFLTIIDRPNLYVNDIYIDPIYVTAGENVSINMNAMTLTGAQIWLWLSAQGGAELKKELGDLCYVGPILISDVTNTAYYREWQASESLGTLHSPFTLENRIYNYTLGNGWINGTIPLRVQSNDVDYWIKIADVSPKDFIPGLEVGVSTNRVRFNPGYDPWYLKGDIIVDGKVDYNDLFYFVEAYLIYYTDGIYAYECDFDWDNDIDYSDLFEFIDCFLAYYESS